MIFRIQLCRVGFGIVVAMMMTASATTAQTPGTSTLVPSPQALGMGGAAAAYPTARTALFYNPAHLTHLQITRAPVTMLGFSASLSNNFSDQLDFYNNRLKPALEKGIDNLDDEATQALYQEAFEKGGAPTVLSGELLLPSFVLNRGSYGFGGGIFAHTEWVYGVEDAGTGVPGIDFTSLADFMALASFGTDFAVVGVKGLSAGLTAKYTQRLLTLKVKPVDAIDDDESFYVLRAGAAVADFGLLYEAHFLPTPGKLYLGLVWSDLALKNFDYKFQGYCCHCYRSGVGARALSAQFVLPGRPGLCAVRPRRPLPTNGLFTGLCQLWRNPGRSAAGASSFAGAANKAGQRFLGAGRSQPGLYNGRGRHPASFCPVRLCLLRQ